MKRIIVFLFALTLVLTAWLGSRGAESDHPKQPQPASVPWFEWEDDFGALNLDQISTEEEIAAGEANWEAHKQVFIQRQTALGEPLPQEIWDRIDAFFNQLNGNWSERESPPADYESPVVEDIKKVTYLRSGALVTYILRSETFECERSVTVPSPLPLPRSAAWMIIEGGIDAFDCRAPLPSSDMAGGE